MTNNFFNSQAHKDDLLREKEVTMSIRVRPGASKTKFTGEMDDGSIKMDVAAVPEDSKANEELVRFLAKEFGVPRGNVSIIGGIATRRKIVRITV